MKSDFDSRLRHDSKAAGTVAGRPSGPAPPVSLAAIESVWQNMKSCPLVLPHVQHMQLTLGRYPGSE
jgi:hypothetical protein